MNKQVKETIKKIIPVNVLRRIRQIMTRRSINRMSREERKPFEKGAFPYGINLIGSFSQDSGLGQSCRLVAQEIEASGVPHAFVDFSSSPDLPKTNHEFDGKYSEEYTYGINLIHVNMHEFHIAWKKIGKENWERHYNIAYWLWEMQEFREDWIPLISQVDEIWTPAEFVSDAVRKVTDKPVYTVPYDVQAPYDGTYDRKHFGLPEDRFLFLMLFDSNSISERKNPYGVINAFKKAFRPEDNVGLVVKIGHAGDEELQKLEESLRGYSVYFIRRMMPKPEVNSLIRACDVYVSLHRSEGYGLVLAEAMLMGTPTIATNYSANTEFQPEGSACLVDCTLKPVGKDIFPYQKEFLWAEPDIAQAAGYMKKLYGDREFYDSIRDRALAVMQDPEKREYPAAAIAERTKEIFK